MGYMTNGLTFNALREANDERRKEWPGEEKCTLEFRGLEIAGEAGELAESILKVMMHAGKTAEKVKKHVRGQRGIAGTTASVSDIALEMGDLLVSLDLLAGDLGINLGDASKAAFNRTSEKYNLRTHIGHDNEWHKHMEYEKP